MSSGAHTATTPRIQCDDPESVTSPPSAPLVVTPRPILLGLLPSPPPSSVRCSLLSFCVAVEACCGRMPCLCFSLACYRRAQKRGRHAYSARYTGSKAMSDTMCAPAEWPLQCKVRHAFTASPPRILTSEILTPDHRRSAPRSPGSTSSLVQRPLCGPDGAPADRNARRRYKRLHSHDASSIAVIAYLRRQAVIGNKHHIGGGC